MESIAQFARMIMLRPLIGIRLRDYFRNVHLQVISVIVLSSAIPFFIFESMNDSFVRFLLVCIICLLSVGIFTYMIGLSKNERYFINAKIMEIFK